MARLMCRGCCAAATDAHNCSDEQQDCQRAPPVLSRQFYVDVFGDDSLPGGQLPKPVKARLQELIRVLIKVEAAAAPQAGDAGAGVGAGAGAGGGATARRRVTPIIDVCGAYPLPLLREQDDTGAKHMYLKDLLTSPPGVIRKAVLPGFGRVGPSGGFTPGNVSAVVPWCRALLMVSCPSRVRHTSALTPHTLRATTCADTAAVGAAGGAIAGRLSDLRPRTRRLPPVSGRRHSTSGYVLAHDTHRAVVRRVVSVLHPAPDPGRGRVVQPQQYPGCPAVQR